MKRPRWRRFFLCAGIVVGLAVGFGYLLQDLMGSKAAVGPSMIVGGLLGGLGVLAGLEWATDT